MVRVTGNSRGPSSASLIALIQAHPHLSLVLRLLCADDDPDMRAILELAFGLDPEIDAEIFPSGAALLERARFGDADVILLDVMMPAPDGYATCRALKADPVTAPIPVLFLTAKSAGTAQEQAQMAGARGCLTKPFDPRTLAAVVRDSLSGEIRR